MCLMGVTTCLASTYKSSINENYSFTDLSLFRVSVDISELLRPKLKFSLLLDSDPRFVDNSLISCKLSP